MEVLSNAVSRVWRSCCCCLKKGLVRREEVNGRVLLVDRTPIGEGAFSSVFVAHCERTGERFALKEIVCQSSEQLKSARSEVKIHRSVGHHSGLLPLIDSSEAPFGSRGGVNVQLIMPLYTKGTLFDLVHRHSRLGIDGNGYSASSSSSSSTSTSTSSSSQSSQSKSCWGMSERSSLRVFRSICSAVHKLHISGFAHRDLKPHNILLSDHGDPCVMDFGSACKIPIRVNSRKQAVMIQDEAAQLCSMPYRAPELFDVSSKTTIDEKVDVWSLGCLLFAITYGRGFSPYECQWRGRKLEPCVVSLSAVINPIRVPIEVRKTYSDDFFALLEWALTVESRHRPTTAQLIDRIDEKWPELLYRSDSNVYNEHGLGNVAETV